VTGAPSAFSSLLAEHGGGHAFVLAGADITNLIKGFRANDSTTLIPATSEASAAAMAEGYCRASGRPAAVLGCGGPGLSSLVPFIAQAASSSLPIVYLTGLSSPRQDEVGWPTSDVALASATGCQSLHVASSEDLGVAFKAVRAALHEQRPIHLAVDARAQVSGPPTASPSPHPPGESGCSIWVDVPKLAVVVGAAALRHASDLRSLVMDKGIPVATDMAARGVIPEDHCQALGHLSYMGPTRAWETLATADATHVLGGSPGLVAELRRRQLHFDVVPSSHVASWLRWAQQSSNGGDARSAWLHEHPPTASTLASAPAQALATHSDVVRLVASLVGELAVHVLDAGLFHQAGAVHLRALQPRAVVSTDCLTLMGWSLGASMGAALARPTDPVIAYLGDGSFHMQGLSLAVAARFRLPVLMLVGRNGAYASSRKRHAEGPGDPAILPACDIGGVAQACGVSACHCADLESLRTRVTSWLAAREPLLITVDVGIEDPSLVGLKTGIPALDVSHG
jgi:acetolactate synthase-1/2/3 large subunit